MYNLPDYLHGAYGVTQAVANRNAAIGRGAIVYVGTAPVNQVEDGGNNLNKPVLVRNIAEARRLFGYSDDWDKYTLCEAMQVHLVQKGVGPIVLINVLNLATHKDAEETSASLTPVNGRITIANAEDIILDTVTVTGKTKGTDYSIAYNSTQKTIVITELTSGGLGSAAITVTYYKADPSAVTAQDVIGSSDGQGMNTGLYAIKNVEQATGYIPAYLVCPGFSSNPTVHEAMYQVSQKINGHWDAWMFVDLPLMNGGTALTMDTAYTYKVANGYTKPNETVCFPMIEGTDGKYYHMSVQRAANFQELLIKNEGIPYHSASNTDCDIAANLWFGAANAGRVYDDSMINDKLNRRGITSIAHVGGRWALWGACSAEYDENNKDDINVAETNLMMLYYISNDFQHRRARDVDKPLTSADLATLISEEQARLDALKKIKALTYGTVYINSDFMPNSDVRSGDYKFTFDVTTVPLAKSLLAIVNWVDTGFETYFEFQ
jgi:hypothetical protein